MQSPDACTVLHTIFVGAHMDIFIQPVLDRMRQIGSSIHLRYLEGKSHSSGPSGNGGTGKEIALDGEESGGGERTSYVILRKEYAYLESLVRSLFEDAKDVKVIVDRRWHERRQASNVAAVANRRAAKDRRAAAPMLDILINVQA
jgi:hypothetical protein